MEEDVVFDLTGVEESDWLKRSPLALVDLALSLPPDTDLRTYLEAHPEMPLAKAVLSGELAIRTPCLARRSVTARDATRSS